MERGRREAGGRAAIWTVVGLALAAAGCGDSEPGTDAGGDGDAETDVAADEGDAVDGEGVEGCAPGTACVPFAWSCAEDGTPTECNLDGTAWEPRPPCAAGMTCDPGTGWCTCGACEVATPEGCVRVGPTCPAGWTDDGDCGCAPPERACAVGEFANLVPECVRVGPQDDCGDGTWGAIPVDADTIYVDAAYAGGDGDGSRERPFPTLAAALAAIPAGTTTPRTVAVAAGRYPEAVTAARPVALRGRCAAQVTVAPPADSPDGVRLEANGSSLSGLTLDGGGTTGNGIHLVRITGAAVADVAVHDVRDRGILCEECETSIERVAVADAGTAGDTEFGDGIIAHAGPAGAVCAAQVVQADVARTARMGIAANECRVTVASSRTADTGGPGIVVQAPRYPRDATVEGNRVERARIAGIQVRYNPAGGEATVTVRGNRVVGAAGPAPGSDEGTGIEVQGVAGTLRVEDNVVSEADGYGITLHGSAGRLSGNRVEGTGFIGLDLVAEGGAIEALHNTVLDASFVGISALNGLRIENNRVARVTSPEAGVDGIAVLLMGEGESATARNRISEADWGVLLSAAAGPATVERNRIDARGYGIASRGSADGIELTVSENDVRTAPVGIVLESSTDQAASHLAARGNRVQLGACPAGVVPCVLTGVRLAFAAEVEVLDNEIRTPDDAATMWSYGVVVVSAAGSVSGNGLSGPASVPIWVHGEPGVSMAPMAIAGNRVVGGIGVGILAQPAGADWTITVSDNRIAGTLDALWPNGTTAGDGIVVVGPLAGDTPIALTGNLLVGNARTGALVSGAPGLLNGNRIRRNLVGIAWQDGAAVELESNEVRCNGSDQPLEDGGLVVPEPPDPPVLPEP